MQRKRGLEIGRPLGFPLLVHGSWFPAGALLAAHLTVSAYGGHDLIAAVLLGISTVLVFFVCVTAKELMQAAVAAALRMPFVDVTLYVFGGVARTAREASHPSKDAAVAFTGPISAAALGALGLFASSHVRGIPANVLWTIGLANLALAAVNLLPGAPLDGGRLFTAVHWALQGDKRRAEITAARIGQVFGLASLAAGVWLATGGIAAVQDTAIGLWLGLAGIFVASCATKAYRAAVTVAHIDHAKVGQWARPFTGRLLIDSVVPTEGGTFAVADNGRLAGIVSGRHKGAPVRDVMVPWRTEISIHADEPAREALERLALSSVLVVLDERGVVRGVLDDSSVRAGLSRR